MMTLLLSLALAVSGSDIASTQAASEPAATAEKEKPKLICRRIADTGSRLAQRSGLLRFVAI